MFREDLDYVEIISLVNLNDVLLIKSILDSEQVEYFIQGWNSYLNRIDGTEAILFAAKEHEQDAKNLVQDLEFSNYRISTNSKSDEDINSPIKY